MVFYDNLKEKREVDDQSDSNHSRCGSPELSRRCMMTLKQVDWRTRPSPLRSCWRTRPSPSTASPQTMYSPLGRFLTWITIINITSIITNITKMIIIMITNINIITNITNIIKMVKCSPRGAGPSLTVEQSGPGRRQLRVKI